ncbi:unnamed protein product [Penicillium olsonii]|nr:unnamed protein product [Penicillium olsonii]
MYRLGSAPLRQIPPSYRTLPHYVGRRCFIASSRQADKPRLRSRSLEFKGQTKKSRYNQVPSPSSYEINLESSSPVWVERDELYLLSQQRTLKLPFAYLRDTCLCSACKDQHSKQRSFRTGDIPRNIRPRSIKWDGSQLSIKWVNDIPGYASDHTSTWSVEILHKPIADTHEKRYLNAPLKWSKKMMDQRQHWISFDDYINEDSKFAAAMQSLRRTGLVFVDNVPESRDMVEKVATRMGPLRNTFYGSTFDVRTVPEAKNVAYTNQFLGFHMDLMYMNEPPGYQLLHCLENSCSGGESLFADTFRVANYMKKRYPEQYRLLCEQRLGYEYRHEDHIYHNKRPIFEIDPKTRELLHVNYSPPFQSAIPSPDGKDHDAQSVGRFIAAIDLFTKLLNSKNGMFEFKLKPGVCVIFDNRRLVHARRQFNASEGSRWLAGAYVDTDALLSCFAVSQRNHPRTWLRNNQELISRKPKITQASHTIDPQEESGTKSD